MGGKHLAAVVVAAAIALTGGPHPARGAGSMSQPVPATPVVLIHGVTCDGPAVWGRRGPGSYGLYGRLLEHGYSEGRTLFTYDYAGAGVADYVTLAGVGLEGTVRRALAASGADRVDVVTFGSGALVARYWAATRSRGPAPLRNLIMVAPPNHGQYQADVLKLLYHTSRLVGDKTAPPADGEGGLPSRAFVSEDQFVAVRANDYRALYAEYVLHGRLLGASGPATAGPSPLAPPDYDTWLLSQKADLLENLVFSSPAGKAPGGSSFGLTLAYYEILSLRVGRQLFLASTAAAGHAPPLPKLEDLISAQWRARVLDYLKSLLLDWGVPKAKQLWARGRSTAGMSLGELLTSLSPEGAATSRLIPEYLAFPSPGGVPCRTSPQQRLVLCNAFLHDWQDQEARAAGSRYVTIAGACPNPLGLVVSGLGPNDLAVEAASALTDPYPADSFRLETGLLWAHGLAPLSGQVAARVLGVLSGPSGETAATILDEPTGSASLWRPSYRLLTPNGSAGGNDPLTVEVQVGRPAASGLEGLSAVAWLALLGPAAGDPPVAVEHLDLRVDPGRADGAVLTGRFTAAAPEAGRRLLLGLRLVPDGSAGPGYLTMGRYLGRGAEVPFAYSVRAATENEAAVTDEPGGTAPAGERPATDSDGDAAGGDGDDDDGDQALVVGTDGDGTGRTDGPADEPVDVPGEDPAVGAGSPPDFETGQPGPGQAEIVPTLQPPLVSVIRVTKLTTDKRENRTFHSRWEWDFGDGEQMNDSDPSHTRATVTHSYGSPGTYRVTAKSFSNGGRLLRDLGWTVQAGEAPVTFDVETIVEPRVSLVLDGPRKWVTGKPARFSLTADVDWPPRTRRQVLRAYPGWTFDVVWEKPGVFDVRAALNVRQSYEFPDQRLTVSNTYVTVVSVELFTPGLTE